LRRSRRWFDALRPHRDARRAIPSTRCDIGGTISSKKPIAKTRCQVGAG
jgi:hypothetical protein